MFKHGCIRDYHQIDIRVHDLKFQVRHQKWLKPASSKKKNKVSINKIY